MSWRNTLGYTIRGAVAAARGAAEGQVAALQAKSQSQRQAAELSYNQRLADLKEQELHNDALFKQAALDEEGRQFDQTDKTKRDIQLTEWAGKFYVVDTERKTMTEVAEIKAGADKAVAKTTAQSEAQVATDANASRERIATENNETDIEEAQIGARAQKYTDDVKRDIAEGGYASAEKIAAWQVAVDEAKVAADAAAAVGGGDASTVDLGLSPDQIDRVDKLSAQYRAEKWVQDLQTMRSEFTRAAATYDRIKQQDDGSNPDLETGVMDIAMINIFQRMIDPGVSVREGDVQLLQQAMGAQAQLGLLYEQVWGAGVKLTKEARAEMFQLITDFYTQAMLRKSKDLSSRYRKKIEIDGLLRDSGVQVSDLGTDFYQEYGQTLEPAQPAAPPDDCLLYTSPSPRD